MDRDQALADFDRARAEWQQAFVRVPDNALDFLKPGDDYALGGLQVHVNWVLSHYLQVLRAISAARFTETRSEDPPGAEARALRDAKSGLPPGSRRKALEEMARLHEAFRAAMDLLPDEDWTRQCPVVYGPGQDPYPTSPEDILGWLRDHYREHIAQSADLIAEWRASTAAG
jgi:DinB family protein